MFLLHLYLCTVYVPWCTGQERILGSPETGVGDGSDVTCGFW